LRHPESLTSEAERVESLCESISSESLEALQLLLDAAPAHLVQGFAQTSLHQLCIHAYSRFANDYMHSQCQSLWPLMALTLQKGASADHVSSHDCYVCKPLSPNECTPLGLLVRRGCAAGVEVLVATHKADVNLRFGDNQHTALHLACSVGIEEPLRTEAMVEKLVSLGADLHAVAADGDTVLHTAVKFGTIAALRALSRLLPASCNDNVQHINLLAYQNSDGNTPLHTVVMNSSNADHSEEILDVLLNFHTEHIQCALGVVDKQGRTVLHTAIELHKLALLQQLLVASSKLGCASMLVNISDSHDADCWCIARRQGVTELSEIVVAYTVTAATAAAGAAAAGGGSSSTAGTTAGAVMVSVGSGGAMTHTDLDCDDVHSAVSKAHSCCLKLLLARSPSAAAEVTSSKQTALHMVDHSKQQCDQLTAALLKTCSADKLRSFINTTDVNGETALQQCVREHTAYAGTCDVCHKCMKALLAAGSDYVCSAVEDVLSDAALLQQPASEAAVAESISTVQALVAVGCSMRGQLHSAVQHCSSRGQVRVLLACGADPFELDESGLTAMHYAASLDTPDEVGAAEDDMLPDDAAVSISVQNIQDLYDAAGSSGKRLVNYMHGSSASTPLHFAARRSAASSVQKLLQLGADATVLDSNERSALHIACECRCAASVELLLAAGADPHAYSSEAKAEGQWQPLHYALLSSSTECEHYQGDAEQAILVLRLLQRSGVRMNALTTGGCSALRLLARHSPSDCTDAPCIARELCKLGSAVRFYHTEHGTLLHAAASSGNAELLWTLLQCGATVNDAGASARAAQGKTALHIAAAAGHAAVVMILLLHGADVTAVDAAGSTALRLCLEGEARGAAACCSLLLEGGSDACNVAAESG
jgi:ankyrin repeat protein